MKRLIRKASISPSTVQIDELVDIDEIRMNHNYDALVYYNDNVYQEGSHSASINKIIDEKIEQAINEGKDNDGQLENEIMNNLENEGSIVFGSICNSFNGEKYIVIIDGYSYDIYADSNLTEEAATKFSQQFNLPVFEDIGSEDFKVKRIR